MIKGDRQYRTTKAQARKFEKALNDAVKPGDSRKVRPILRKAQRDALRSQPADLVREIQQYEGKHRSSGASPPVAK
jgi:hypothetical protein